MPLLEVKALECSFKRHWSLGLRRERRQIVAGVTFSLESGETLAVVGESGSGKTTLVRCIAGLVEADAGTIDFLGINLFPDVRNRKLVRQKIQLLFQNHSDSLDPQLSVYRSLVEGLGWKWKKGDDQERRALAERWLSMVGLPTELLDSLPHRLSGGQRQRVALARALVVSPDLLILDEPTSALDLLTQVQVLRLVKDLQQKQSFALIYVSHDVETTLLLCDQIAVLHGGSIVEMGEVDAVVPNPRHPYTQRLLTMSRMKKASEGA
ncbi:MAG: ATP-binding cassette domain-containing protein [Bacteroidota bacterium]